MRGIVAVRIRSEVRRRLSLSPFPEHLTPVFHRPHPLPQYKSSDVLKPRVDVGKVPARQCLGAIVGVNVFPFDFEGFL